VNRSQLLQELQRYLTDDPTEYQFVDRFIALLQHPDAFQRTHLPGHITGSAWICDRQGIEVLLTHHAKLDRWLQPGGHADGDEDVIRVALREAEEETGLQGIALVSEGIFDIDIHTIPKRGDMPEHLHYDIRYRFQADRNLALIVTEESHALSWVKLEDVERVSMGNASMMRMARKRLW